MYRKNMVESPRCECGEEEEDIEHVVWRCNRFEEERRKLREELREKGIREGENIAERINGDNPWFARKVVGFLHKVKLKI